MVLSIQQSPAGNLDSLKTIPLSITILLYSEYLTRANQLHHQVDSIYLDIHKAFDTVPHSRLLSKLWDSGITGNLWWFFKVYLVNRSQCVSINGQVSSWLPVSSGVPQASILGPLLFALYINNLPSLLLSSQILLFTDDTKCSRSLLLLSDSTLLQADLDRLYHWSSLNNHSCNTAKCQLLHFTNTCSSLIETMYHLNGTPVSPTSHCKDLGIIFSNCLSWSHPYELLCSRAYRQLRLTHRIFSSAVRTKVKNFSIGLWCLPS